MNELLQFIIVVAFGAFCFVGSYLAAFIAGTCDRTCGFPIAPSAKLINASNTKRA
jgi:pyruvate formate-lyase activating enzyme-like uncharacterized protein